MKLIKILKGSFEIIYHLSKLISIYFVLTTIILSWTIIFYTLNELGVEYLGQLVILFQIGFVSFLIYIIFSLIKQIWDIK